MQAKKNGSLQKLVGKNVRLVRETFDLSQEQLAVLAGLTRDTIQKLETGMKDSRLSTVEAIARVFDADPMIFLDPALKIDRATPPYRSGNPLALVYSAPRARVQLTLAHATRQSVNT